MATRLTRAERTERNRAALLGAARRVFLERGYHAATLDQIAEEAGFSKGVVYSQFRGKADLFLALLEERIEQRARENAQAAKEAAGAEGIGLLLGHAARASGADRQWGLVVLEFRVHAARDPELNRRYAVAHARTVDELAAIVSEVYARAGEAPPAPARELAVLILAVGTGSELEHAADPDALPEAQGSQLVARLLAGAERAPA